MEKTGKRIRTAVFCALFAALTAAGAFVRIPLPFSAITLQFLFTALAGVLLGPFAGALSQLIYVALGLAGLPVFAAGGGVSYFFVPSCGFVLGLPAAAFVIGALTRRAPFRRGEPHPRVKNPWRIALACTAGLAALYLIGLSYMAAILNGYLGKGMNAGQIAMAGMIPFLPGDALKILFCTVLCAKLPDRFF